MSVSRRGTSFRGKFRTYSQPSLTRTRKKARSIGYRERSVYGGCTVLYGIYLP